MRTRLIVTLIMIGVASSACAQSSLFLQHQSPFGSRRSTLTGTNGLPRTADRFTGDLVARQMLQDGDVRGPRDVIGPAANTKERALRGAAVGAFTDGAVFGAAFGALVGALSNEFELREGARERVRLRGRNKWTCTEMDARLEHPALCRAFC